MSNETELNVWCTGLWESKSSQISGILTWRIGGGYVHDAGTVSGFEDASFPNKVCFLKKALYGLRQASRAWNDKLNKFLQDHQFVQTAADI